MRMIRGMVIIVLLTGMTDATIHARTDLRSLHVALIAYRAITEAFPTTAQGIEALVTRPIIEPKPKTWSKVFEKEIRDPWGRKYIYKCPGDRNPKGYDLFSLGKDGKAETADDIWAESQ